MWPPSEALYCDVNAILLGDEGRTDVLLRIGLLRRADGDDGRPRQQTGQPRDARGEVIYFDEKVFDRLVRGSNAGQRRRTRSSG